MPYLGRSPPAHEIDAVTSDEIQADVAYVLQHLPDTLRLVILSRAEPDLPLGLLRARDELLEIRVKDLGGF